MGRSRKEELYCFARQKGPEWANTLKIVYLHLEGIERSFAVMALKGMIRDFLGHPVVKTPHFQCQGYGFDLWSGN